MQVASRQPLWGGNGRGTFLEVEMTPETGLYIKFFLNPVDGNGGGLDWGDGSFSATVGPDGLQAVEHTYASYGHYKLRLVNLKGAVLRWLDGQPQYQYDGAIVSYVDYDNVVDGCNSGGFEECRNLERVIMPEATGLGQRTFAGCTKLKEAVMPLAAYFYDGTFERCSSLETLELGGGTLWSAIFWGCTNLREIRFTHVDQISDRCFGDCPSLTDIYMGDKTIAQVMQTSGDGDIIAGYGARFPWDANPTTRFHCLDGIVLGNGSVINGQRQS